MKIKYSLKEFKQYLKLADTEIKQWENFRKDVLKKIKKLK